MPTGFTEKQQEEIRENLFLSGIRLIRKLGIQRTTVDKLTKDCGIAKGSFYLFYTCKKDYLIELEEYVSAKMQEMLQRYLAKRQQMTAEEFCLFFKEWLYCDYDIMSHLTVEDFLWIKTHMAQQNYFDPTGQQQMIEKYLTLISDAREDVDPGTVVNLIKCIYAMREHRDTMVAASIDSSIDVILRTLAIYISGKTVRF